MYKATLFLSRARHIIFSIAVAMIKIINTAIGKKNKAWYVDNIFDLILITIPNPIFNRIILFTIRIMPPFGGYGFQSVF